MRILFIGAVAFSAHSLREQIAMGANIVGVCTLKESKFNADHHDLTAIAEQAGIPVYYTPALNSEEVTSSHGVDTVKLENPAG